jgi:hypothetical protein
MTRASLSNRLLTKLMAILFLGGIQIQPSHAQSPDGLEILVTGPWSFVSNGDGRLYLVAGYNKYHFANIRPGTDTRMQSWQPGKGTNLCPSGPPVTPCVGTKQNLYILNFDSPQALNGSLQEETLYVYSATSKSDVNSILNTPPTTTPRYAISLPMPNHTHTYSGDFGPGVSEAKISQGQDPDEKTKTSQYTTYTVLRYDQQASSATVNTKTAADQAPFPVTVSAGDNDRKDRKGKIVRHGITISLMEAPLCADSGPGVHHFYPQDCHNATDMMDLSPVDQDDAECDTLSLLSFAQTASLWGLSERARFPLEEVSSDSDDPNYTGGTQSPWNFDYACPVSSAGNLATLITSEDNVVETNLNNADLSASLLALKYSRGPLVSHERPKPWLNAKTVQLLLDNIARDLKEGANVSTQEPIMRLQDKLYCACKAADIADCQRAGAPNECRAEKTASKSWAEFFKAADAYMAANDKSSADCHAPQVSINGAIQPMD